MKIEKQVQIGSSALSLQTGHLAKQAQGSCVVRYGDTMTLTAAVETPGLKTRDRVEMLYLATLSRPPTERETERVLAYLARAGAAREPERLADVYWVLLNSAEFRLNH